jgi:hypothetical protein
MAASSSSITAGGNITGSGTISGDSPVISAGGYIGTMGSPIDYSTTGTLNVSASDMSGMVSIVLAGSGNLSWGNNAPGFVFVNGALMNGVGQQSFRATLEQGSSVLYPAPLASPFSTLYVPSFAPAGVGAIPAITPALASVIAPSVSAPPAEGNLRISNVKTALGTGANNMPVGPTNKFAAGTDKISLSFSWNDAREGSAVLTKWYDVTRNIQMPDYALSISTRSGSTSVSLSAPDGKPLKPGLYRVDLYANGVKMKSIEFKVLEKK